MIINDFFCKAACVVWLLSGGDWVAGANAAEGLFPQATVMAAPQQPTKLPDFELPNVNGGTLKSADMKGKVIIIRFWATW
jgi:cytochrome oxidase Cu insertion factor (SCO1/SenC/PrrC family)